MTPAAEPGRELVAFAALDRGHRTAVRRVYETSFPSHLRAPWAEITAARPDEQLMVLLDEHDRTTPPVGLVLVRHLGPTSVTFLRYFVVDADRRGRGHGAALWSALVTHLHAAHRQTLLFDVEDPSARPPRSPEEGHDRRRIAFYQGHGAHLLDVQGYAPPDHGLTGEEPRLLLMGTRLQSDPAVPLPAQWSAGELRDAVVAVYRFRYGLLPDHPTVAATLAASRLR
jgi:GNAT superfamily N-acetyltransferase